MQTVIIENTDLWRIDSIGNGLAYVFTNKHTGETGMVQGEDATAWRADYDEMYKDVGDPNTRAYRFTWNQILDGLCGAYVRAEA